MSEDLRFVVHNLWIIDIDRYHLLYALGFHETAVYFTSRGLMFTMDEWDEWYKKSA